MFIPRLLSVRHKLLIDLRGVVAQLFRQIKIRQIEIVKDKQQFPIDLMQSDQAFNLLPLGHKPPLVNLPGLLPLQTLDTIHHPTQRVIHHQHIVIPHSSVPLHKRPLQRCQHTVTHNFLFTGYPETRSAPTYNIDIVSIVRQVQVKVRSQRSDSPQHNTDYYIFESMSSFEFDFFQEHPPAPGPNLEQVMEQLHRQSFEFDQFDPVNEGPSHDKSFNSDFFDQQPKPQSNKPEEKVASAKSKGKNQSFDFQNSRNISEISYLNEERNKSFRYEQPPQQNPFAPKPNARYEKLQQMLGQAKKNSLDTFYKNLDQQNIYPVEEKFRNKEEFNLYRNQLKSYKRDLQYDYKEQVGSYNFRNNHYNIPNRQRPNVVENIFDSKNSNSEKPNFKKKQSNPTQKNQPEKQPNYYLLPAEYSQPEQDFNFFQMPELPEEEIKKEVDKYKQIQYQKQAERFFKTEDMQIRQKKPKQAAKLESIRQQRPNIFELSHQQQKMNKLLGNYADMKRNFNDLMSGLKQSNSDQERIIGQLKNLKQEYQNKQSRLKIEAENKRQKRQVRERQRETKQRKMVQIKQQISKMREGGEKDILFLKINQKIQNLQQIVKTAITQMNQQKQTKFVPKIINYYRDQPQSNRSNSRNSQAGFSRSQHGQPEQQALAQLNEQQMLAPVRNAIRQLKEQRREEQELFNLNEFSSPLQLDLTSQEFPLNLSHNRSQQLEQPFVPPEGAKHYLPNALDSTNKYLRRCLTQKSSVVFQSFEFYVTGKFTMTGNDRYPVLCEVRVANKCAVSLYDVFVVVFGPQAQQSELQMRPPKLMHDEFKHSTSFLFEVDLSKSCLESGGFSVMISYKTDSVNKKKVIFKVPLPFVQLIKPEFIYEEQFVNGWNHMPNELYVSPKTLDFKNIRSHEDLKLILPLIEVAENDPNAFSYGIMFRYPTSSTAFMMKITCYVTGKASLHLKSSETSTSDRKLREETLDIMNFLCFG